MRDLAEFDGKVHSIPYYTDEVYKGKSCYNWARMTCTETKDEKDK